MWSFIARNPWVSFAYFNCIMFWVIVVVASIQSFSMRSYLKNKIVLDNDKYKYDEITKSYLYVPSEFEKDRERIKANIRKVDEKIGTYQ